MVSTKKNFLLQFIFHKHLMLISDFADWHLSIDWIVVWILSAVKKNEQNNAIVIIPHPDKTVTSPASSSAPGSTSSTQWPTTWTGGKS